MVFLNFFFNLINDYFFLINLKNRLVIDRYIFFFLFKKNKKKL